MAIDGSRQCHRPVCSPDGVCGLAVDPGAARVDRRSCTQGGVCQEDGQCAGTDPAPGTCFVAGACYQADEPNLANVCEVCDPSRSRTAFSALIPGGAPPPAGARVISGVGYLPGPNLDFENACFVCDPVRSQTAASPVDREDGDVCTLDHARVATGPLTHECRFSTFPCPPAINRTQVNLCVNDGGNPQCRLTSRDAGAANCNGASSWEFGNTSRCPVDLTSDGSHCGACGASCVAGQTCSNGRCV